jgi:hypothetical protein
MREPFQNVGMEPTQLRLAVRESLVKGAQQRDDLAARRPSRRRDPLPRARRALERLRQRLRLVPRPRAVDVRREIHQN